VTTAEKRRGLGFNPDGEVWWHTYLGVSKGSIEHYAP
jgi:hypothetical protein